MTQPPVPFVRHAGAIRAIGCLANVVGAVLVVGLAYAISRLV